MEPVPIECLQVCERETEILVEHQPPQGFLVCDHAGLAITKFSNVQDLFRAALPIVEGETHSNAKNRTYGVEDGLKPAARLCGLLVEKNSHPNTLQLTP